MPVNQAEKIHGERPRHPAIPAATVRKRVSTPPETGFRQHPPVSITLPQEAESRSAGTPDNIVDGVCVFRKEANAVPGPDGPLQPAFFRLTAVIDRLEAVA